MNRTPDSSINFADTVEALSSGQVWEYETAPRGECRDVPGQSFNALQGPIDFPPLEGAIVSGDRVALAVDPNVPELLDVLQGAIKAIGQTDAGKIDIVLGDEATDETVDTIQEEFGSSIRVTRHQSSDRSELRYVAADESAAPVYLNRNLVDADFVLPIAAGRPLDAACEHDLTGVFPAFADSATRQRHSRRSNPSASDAKEAVEPSETVWLLGIQVMLSVTASDRGRVGQVIAGTPDAIRKQLLPAQRSPDEFPPAATLVIASLDGDAQQQSWSNAARAVAAASRYAKPAGTIVLWSAIEQPPTGRLLSLDDADPSDFEDAPPELDAPPEGDDFPPWDESNRSARTLCRIASEHRLLIHSRLDQEEIESMGLGSIQTPEELSRLSESNNSCGILRAAQFAGTTADTPIQTA